MTYRGRVREGLVLREDNVTRLEGTVVSIEPVDESDGDLLRDSLFRLAGALHDLPLRLSA